jgi:hypothetical protein
VQGELAVPWEYKLLNYAIETLPEWPSHVSVRLHTP